MAVTKTDQILKLIDKANDNLNAAKYLLEEGFYNISTTRSYYTMFYLTTAALITIDLSFSKHSGLISAFGREFAATKIINPECHRMLIEANKYRQTSDYDFMNEVTAGEAEEIKISAEQFSNELLNYLEEWMEKT
jgi:uncharacterized protein (UPF0332 family)